MPVVHVILVAMRPRDSNASTVAQSAGVVFWIAWFIDGVPARQRRRDRGRAVNWWWGHQTDDIAAHEVIWEFVKEYRLPR